MTIKLVFRGLRQLFVVSGLVGILIFCAHQPLNSLAKRSIASLPGATASDFSSACAQLASVRGFDMQSCQNVQKAFFAAIPAGKAMVETSPKAVGAPTQKIDSKIRYLAFNDASAAAALSYCYFVFKGSIDPKAIEAGDLNLATTGFSISSQDVGAYQNWVETNPAGKNCKTHVEQQTGYALPDAESELQGKLALVGLNPLAALNGGFTDMKTLTTEMKLSLNHGRIYAYIQSCPVLEAWGQKQWLSLSEQDRGVIKSKLSAYKWDDIQVAGRQYTAFTFENDPDRVLSLTKDCDL